jgi:phospholipid transport system substrate-binding protein
MAKTLRFLLVLLALSLVSTLAHAEGGNEDKGGSDGPSAREVMEGTVVEVVAILKDASMDTRARRGKLEQIAYERFDFRTMSRLVLAKNWRRLSKDQQKEFVKEFRLYLANDYGSRLDRYGDEDVAIVGERTEARGDVTIKTEIQGGENNGALVDYRMRDKKTDWKIIDVVIEGISLVANFRDQFREVISKEGPEGLLEKLREKNASNEA